MVRPRPTEIKMVAELLQEPAEDADALARTIIEALDAKREGDPRYVTVIYIPGVGLFAFGTYGTPLQAKKDIGRRVVAASEGARGQVLQVIDPKEK